MRKPLTLALAAGLLGAGSVAIGQNLDPAQVTQPADVIFYDAPEEELLALGETLFDDPDLGTTGNSCLSCHMEFANYNPTFNEPYPHPVAMASQMAGMDEVTAAEMVQLCMVVPMGGEPLEWNGIELAALTAFVEAEQRRFVDR